mmetsp:Transcript_84507/g.229392  ORF Transcript_84507/g.229392 Transcript_84507/m.229392 type:complete len:228 (-) Transcript_84507:68-751(-)
MDNTLGSRMFKKTRSSLGAGRRLRMTSSIFSGSSSDTSPKISCSSISLNSEGAGDLGAASAGAAGAASSSSEPNRARSSISWPPSSSEPNNARSSRSPPSSESPPNNARSSRSSADPPNKACSFGTAPAMPLLPSVAAPAGAARGAGGGGASSSTPDPKRSSSSSSSATGAPPATELEEASSCVPCVSETKGRRTERRLPIPGSSAPEVPPSLSMMSMRARPLSTIS